MTGFFLVRRDKVILERLEPEGFKILLEILVRCPDMRIAELLFDFGERNEGESKADFREGMRFFRHLWRLRVTAHQRPMGRYLLIALIGFLLNNAIFVTVAAPIGRLWAAVLATELSILWTFWGNTRFVFPPEEGLRPKFGRYLARNQLFLLIMHIPLIALLGRIEILPLVVINTAAILITAGVRYLLSDRWIWTRDLIARRRELAFYDIHGQLTLETPIPLPILDYFRVTELSAPADIRIRLDRHGTPRQIRNTVSYDEGLGRLGYAVTVHPTDEYAEVVVSPLVQRSPYVLYVNVVEPLIRWLLLQRGWRLLQAGGWQEPSGEIVLASDSDPAIMSDSVLQALRSSSGRRLIGSSKALLSPNRTVYPFPTPPIAGKWLESSWIRQVGARLREWGMPVATVNTMVQWLLPPKFEPLAMPIGESGRVGAVQFASGSAEPNEVSWQQIEANGRDPYGFPMFDLLNEVRQEPVGSMAGSSPV